MATQQWHAQCRKLRGSPLAGLVNRAQSIGWHSSAKRRDSGCYSCLAGRQHIKVKGLSHGSEHASLWYGEYCRRRKLQQHSGPTSLSRRNNLARCTAKHRGGSSNIAGGRLLRQHAPAVMQSSSGLHSCAQEWHVTEDTTSQQRAAVPSHPISVASSACTSETGSNRVSETGSTHSDALSTVGSAYRVKKVLGLPQLPLRRGPTAKREARKYRPETTFELLRKFLRRDYANGYLLLGWLLRTTWAIAPSVAKLLGLPQSDYNSAFTQLPGLVAWMLSDSSNSKGSADAESRQVVSLLTTEELQRLHEQLTSPQSAMTSLGNFMQAQQSLSGAPATAQQMAEFLMKDHRLRTLYKDVSPAENLACAGSAAAAMAQLSATEHGALAASSAAAAMVQLVALQQNLHEACNATAASPSTADSSQLAKDLPASQEGTGVAGSVITAATVGTAACIADTAAAITDTAINPAAAGPRSVLMDMAIRIGNVMQQVSCQLTAANKMQSGDAATAEDPSRMFSGPAAALGQLLSLQQRLPAHQDKVALLQEYQLWIDQVKGCLVQQHEASQVHLLHLESELVLAATSLQQSQAYQQQVVEQQQMLQQSRQQALDRYQQATDTISKLLQQMDAAEHSSIGTTESAASPRHDSSATIEKLGTLVTEAEGAEAEMAVAEQQLQLLLDTQQTIIAESEKIQAQLQELQTTYNTLAAADSEQVAAKEELDDAMASLDAALADVAENTDRASEELDALMQLLINQPKRIKTDAAVTEADTCPTAAFALDGPLFHMHASVPQVLSVLDSIGEACANQEGILADADNIIAEAEKLAGSHIPNTEFGPQQQIVTPDAADPVNNITPRARILAPLRPKFPMLDETATLFVDQPSQCTLSNTQLPTTEQVGEHHQGVSSSIATSLVQAAALQQGYISKEDLVDMLSAWASSQLALGSPYIQQPGTATAGHCNSTAAAATEARSNLDGKDGSESRTLREVVSAASGLLSFISPNWWTEEALGSATEQSIVNQTNWQRAPAKLSTAAAGDVMVQAAFGSDGSGNEGAGGNGDDSKPKGGGGGGTPDDSNDSSSGGSGGDSGDDGPHEGGGSGGNGGKGPTGPSDAWDGFDHFPPPGGLDPVVLLPVAFAAAVASLQMLLAAASSAEDHSPDANDSNAVVPLTPSQEAAVCGARGKVTQERDKQHSCKVTALNQEERMQAIAGAAAAAAARAGKGTAPAYALQGLRVPDSSDVLMADADSVQHLLRCDPADDGILLAQSQENSPDQAVLDSAVSMSSLVSNPALGHTTTADEPSHAALHTQMVASACCTGQQVSWEDLEELPMIARQEILSLRAIVARNNNVHEIFAKQLQVVQQQVAAKDAELAASTAKSAQLQAELDAALNDLGNLATGSVTIDSSVGTQSVKELKQGYQSQISMLAQMLAAERTTAATQVAALQAQLELGQLTAAQEIADLQTRLSKVAVSKAKLQQNFGEQLAILQADLATAQQEAIGWKATAGSAEAALVAAQQQLSVTCAEAAEQIEHSKALLAVEQADKHSIQVSLATAAVTSALPSAPATGTIAPTELGDAVAGNVISVVVQQLQQQVEQLLGHYMKLLSDFQTQSKELAAVKQVSEAQQALAADERHKATAALQQISQVSAQLAEAKQEVEKLAIAEARVKAVQGELFQLHSRYVADTSLLEESVQSANERCQELQQQLAVATTAADQILERLAEAETDHQAAIETAHAEVAAAGAAAAARVQVLEDQLTAAQAATAAAQATAATAVQDVLRLTKELDNATLHAAELKHAHSAELAALKDGHSIALAQAVDAATAENKLLIDRHEAAVQQLRQKHAAATAELQQQATSALEACNMTHDEAVGMLTAELATLSASAENKVRELDQQHRAVVQALREKQADDLAAAVQQAADESERLAASYAATAQTLQQQHAEQIAELQQQLETATSDAQLRHEELKQKHEAATVALTEQHTAAIAAADQEAADTMAALSVAHTAALTELEVKYEARVSEIQQQMSAAADGAKLMAEDLQNQLRAAVEAHATAAQNASSTASTLADLEAQLAAVHTQSEHEITQLRSKHAAARKESATQLQALQQQVEDLQIAVAAAIADKDRLQQELAEAASVASVREDNLRQQLDAVKQGLQDNIRQMETTANDLAAAEARQAQLSADKSALDADRAEVLHRCQAAELQLLQVQEQQTKQIDHLLALRTELCQACGLTTRAAVNDSRSTDVPVQAVAETETLSTADGVTPDCSSADTLAIQNSSAQLQMQSGNILQLVAQIAELAGQSGQQWQKRLDELSAELFTAHHKADEWQAAAQAAELQQKIADSAYEDLQQLLQVHVAEAAVAQGELKSARTQLQQLQSQHQGAVRQLAAVQAGNSELQAVQAQQQLQIVALTAQISSSEQQTTMLQQQLAETAACKEELQQQLQMTLSDLQLNKERLEAAEAQMANLQQQVQAAGAAAIDANTARVHAEAQVKESRQRLEFVEKELHAAKQQLTAAEEAQSALSMQLLEKSQEIKLFKDDSSAFNGSWRLPTEVNLGSSTGSAEVALAEAKHQLSCWEEDVMALQFVAAHENLKDIADLDVTYNNSLLESIHKAIVKMRKAAADATAEASRLSAMTSISRLSSAAGDALSPRGTWRMASPNSAASSSRSSISAAKSTAAAKLAALEAQAGKATTRSMAFGSALDSSMQAMQAAKQSLLSMHHNDLKLELISQSVQEVLAGKSQTSLHHNLGDLPVSSNPSDLTRLTARAARTSSLLAARTTQEADEVVARLASTLDGGATAAHMFNDDSTPEDEHHLQAADVQEMTAELQQYKQQVYELHAAKQALQQEVGAAREVADQLAVVQADKQAIDAANKQLLLQVQILSDEASSLQHTAAQLAETQAAHAELSASKQQLEHNLSALREELQQLKLQQEQYETQTSMMRGLEDEVAALWLQLQDLMRHNKDLADQLAAARAVMHSGGAAVLSASSDAAVSAVRAMTHSLMLHSGRFSVSIDDEQLMHPTCGDDGQVSSVRAKLPSRETADAYSTSSLQPLHQPLQAESSTARHQQSTVVQSSDGKQQGTDQPTSTMTKTEYMHYSGTANMALSMLEGSNRRPALPTTEDHDTESIEQRPADVDASAAVDIQVAISTATAGGVVALTTGPDGRKSALQSQKLTVINTAKDSGVSNVSGIVGKQLAQQVVNKLIQENGMERRGSWPEDPKAVAHAQSLASVVHDISKLGELSSELVEQQIAVQQQLAASQALARSMSEQTSAHDVSMEEVIGHFFKVYNVATYVAADRERVLDLLIEARAANQDQASQLAHRSNQIQQLASDRDLAMRKLCHSEEKLVALEGQLLSLQQQVQDKQKELAAIAAVLDVAECPDGPLAELNADQLQHWRQLLAEANHIVKQQKSLVQSAVLRWKRSSQSEDIACGIGVVADAKGDSSSQMAWLQQEQLLLAKELEGLAAADRGNASISNAQHSGTEQQQQQLAMGKPPKEGSTCFSSLIQRMAAMHRVLEQVSVEMSKKDKEAIALQDSLAQAEATKQLLAKQLTCKSSGAGLLQPKGSKNDESAASPTGPKAAVSPAGGNLQRQRTASNAVELTAQGVPTVLDIDLQPGKPGYVLGVAQHFDPGFKRLSSLAQGSDIGEIMGSAGIMAPEDRVAVAEANLGLTAPSLPPWELAAPASPRSTAVPQPATGVELPGQLSRRGSLTPKPGPLGSLTGSARASPISSPRLSGAARMDSAHWIPASVSLSPRTSGSAPSLTSPRSPILKAAAAAAARTQAVGSTIHGSETSADAMQKKFGSQSEPTANPSKVATQSSIPSAAAASSGDSGTNLVTRSGSALPSRIPGVAGVSSAVVSKSFTPTTNSSTTSSPMHSPRPLAATAASSHRPSPVFKSSRTTATGTASSRAVSGKAGLLSASTDNVRGSSGGADGLGKKVVRVLSGGSSKGAREGANSATAAKSSASKTKSTGGHSKQ